jgi:AraC-like DNA-binding protein
MWELSWVMVGRGERTMDDCTEPFEQGDVVLVPPDMNHCWKFDPQCVDEHGEISNTTIIFHPQTLAACASLFPEFASVVEALEGSRQATLYQGGLRERITALLRAMHDKSDAERVGLLLQILPLLVEGEGSSPIGGALCDDKSVRLNRITTYLICAHQRRISLDDVAQHVGMSRSSLCNFFKHHTGQTIFNYLNHFRIDMACDMLSRTSNSVAEICYKVGFGDLPYFNRTFKKIVGATPTEYRQNKKGGD